MYISTLLKYNHVFSRHRSTGFHFILFSGHFIFVFRFYTDVFRCRISFFLFYCCSFILRFGYSTAISLGVFFSLFYCVLCCFMRARAIQFPNVKYSCIYAPNPSQCIRTQFSFLFILLFLIFTIYMYRISFATFFAAWFAVVVVAGCFYIVLF